jgi:hypothetical protein
MFSPVVERTLSGSAPTCDLPDSPERHRHFGRLRGPLRESAIAEMSLHHGAHWSPISQVKTSACVGGVRRNILGDDEVAEATSPQRVPAATLLASPVRERSEALAERPIIPVFDFSGNAGAAATSPASYCTSPWLVLARCATDVVDLSDVTQQFMIVLPDSVLYVSSAVELPAMLYCKLLIRSQRRGLPEPPVARLHGLSPAGLSSFRVPQQDKLIALQTDSSRRAVPLLPTDKPRFADPKRNGDASASSDCEGSVSECGESKDPTPRYLSDLSAPSIAAPVSQMDATVRPVQTNRCCSTM